jgi:hypothetical protein
MEACVWVCFVEDEGATMVIWLPATKLKTILPNKVIAVRNTSIVCP